MAILFASSVIVEWLRVLTLSGCMARARGSSMQTGLGGTLVSVGSVTQLASLFSYRITFIGFSASSGQAMWIVLVAVSVQ